MTHPANLAGMDTSFDQLREQATSKRDAAIKVARDEWALTMREIDAIERKIGGPRKRTRKSRILFYIAECIQPGQPFSIGSIVAALAERFPKRDTKRDHVKRCLLHLKKSGLIQLVGRNDSGGPVYVATKSQS